MKSRPYLPLALAKPSPSFPFSRINLFIASTKASRGSASSSSPSTGKGKLSASTPKAAPLAPTLPKCVIPSSDGTVRLIINAKPNSKVSAITGIDDDGIGVAIGAPAIDGKANEELVDFMSEVLATKKRDLELDKGAKSKNKVIIVTGMTPEDVLARISAYSINKDS